MLTINIDLQKIEVVRFDRTTKTVTLKIFYNSGNDEEANISYIPQHPEQAAEEILKKIKQSEKSSRKEQGDPDDLFAGVVHVIFNNEEKTVKTLCRFLTQVNDKVFYLNRSRDAGDHMNLVQVLQNLRTSF